MRKYIVIGAGISGLALAWYLKKKYGRTASIKILEKSERAGGWIRTRNQNGYLFEEGPRSCRARGSGISTLELVEDLGLASLVIGASKEAKKRYIYLNGRLEEVPSSLASILKSPLTKGIAFALLNDLVSSKKSHDNVYDETVAEFAQRRLNPEIAARLIDPFISGIYAGDMHRLSLRSCFPDLFKWDQQGRSILASALINVLNKPFKKDSRPEKSDFIRYWENSPMISFREGMGALTARLTEKLKEELITSCEVSALKNTPDSISVHLKDGQTLQADKIFLATPFDTSLSLLQSADIDTPKKTALEAASIAAVSMGWRKQILNTKGFGYLIPSTERDPLDNLSCVLGVVFDSTTFPLQNRQKEETRLTVMLGGMCEPQVEYMPFSKLEAIASEALQKHLRIIEKPDEIHVSLAKRAIPQYVQGHSKMVQDLESALLKKTQSRLVLLGNSWHGVSVNDCIASAKKAADLEQ